MAVNKKNDPATIQTVTNGGFKIRFLRRTKTHGLQQCEEIT